LPQLPQDSASGAARSTTAIAELLSAAGFHVRALASSATESAIPLDPLACLRSTGIDPRIDPTHNPPLIRYTWRGIDTTILPVGAPDPWHAWQKTLNPVFDQLFDRELETFSPDILFTYGGSAGDIGRMRRARRRGCRVVFSLRNLNYRSKAFFDEVDSILTPSRFLTQRYRETIGLESTPILAPLDTADVLASERAPIFVTMVNPSLEKGAAVFARIAEVVSLRNPRIPFLVIESRGTAGLLVDVGLRGGFDLRRHTNLMVSPAVSHPRDIFTPARILLVPSLVEEAGGRIPAEALLNGVPPLVSDRGGLAEVCCGAGFVLPIPSEVHRRTSTPVPASLAEPWVQHILRLCQDESAYEAAVAQTQAAARHYLPEILQLQYVDYFRRVLAQPPALTPQAPMAN
jgi:glycosyltransferase involved in cell wall biosynthesis